MTEGWISKRARAAASVILRALYAVDERWLETAASLNIYSLVWRTYTWSLEAFDMDDKVGLFSSSSEWLILSTTVLSYVGLFLLVFFPPLYLLQTIARSLNGEQHQQQQQSKDHIHTASLFLVAVLTTLSNYSGIVDITLVPLVADLMLHSWHWCAIFSACIACTVLPLYITSSRQRVWHALWLPSVVCSVSASDLTLILRPHPASSLLSLGFIMWGAAAIPSICFAIGYIRRISRSWRLSVLVPPLAVVSQLALGIMSLGVQSRRVWGDTVGPATAPLLLGELAMAAGAILGLVLWAASAAWFINAHVLAVWLRRGRQQGNWLSVSVCQVAYPVASFTMATVYVARIWSSHSALMCSRLLIGYLSVVLLAVPAARAAVGTMRFTRRMARSRLDTSRSRQLPTYGTIEHL